MTISWRSALDKIIKDDVPTQAAALAFYMGSAIVPLFVLMISVLAALNESMMNQMADRISSVVGDDASRIFQAVAEAAHNRPKLSSIGGIAGILVLLISTSVIFRQMESAFSRIFRQQKAPTPQGAWPAIRCFFKRQALAILMMLLFVVMTIASVSTSMALAYIISDKVWFFKVLNILFDLVAFTMLFAATFKLLLMRPARFFHCLVIGFFVALFFAFGKDAISLYLKNSAMSPAYGAAGFPMALFIWLYYSACIIFFGAEALAIFWMRPHEKI